MKQLILSIILVPIFFSCGNKQSESKNEEASIVVIAEPQPEDTNIDSVAPQREYTLKELTVIMDTLNARSNRISAATHLVSGWALMELERRIDIYMIEYSAERIAEYRKLIMDSPALFFVNPSYKLPTAPICTQCNVTMYPSPRKYKLPVDSIKLVITNNTEHEGMAGEDLMIEKQNGNEWNIVPLNYNINSIGYGIQANGTRTFDINLQPKTYNYKAGTYRAYKVIHLNGTASTLIAEFEIVE